MPPNMGYVWWLIYNFKPKIEGPIYTSKIIGEANIRHYNTFEHIEKEIIPWDHEDSKYQTKSHKFVFWGTPKRAHIWATNNL